MSKSTPGPWVAAFFVNKESDLIQPLVIGHERWALCSAERNPILIAGVFSSAPSEADARLIAAAPELLKAAKQALALIPQLNGNRDTFFVEDLRKAIAKAEGTSE